MQKAGGKWQKQEANAKGRWQEANSKSRRQRDTALPPAFVSCNCSCLLLLPLIYNTLISVLRFSALFAEQLLGIFGCESP